MSFLCAFVSLTTISERAPNILSFPQCATHFFASSLCLLPAMAVDFAAVTVGGRFNRIPPVFLTLQLLHQQSEEIIQSQYKQFHSQTTLCHQSSVDDHALLVAVEKTLRVWSIKQRKWVATLCGHEDTITAIVVHPDSATRAFTTSLDGTVREWDLIEARCVHTTKLHTAIIQAAIINGVMYANINEKLYRKRSKNAPNTKHEQSNEKAESCDQTKLPTNASNGMSHAKTYLLEQRKNSKKRSSSAISGSNLSENMPNGTPSSPKKSISTHCTSSDNQSSALRFDRIKASRACRIATLSFDYLSGSNARSTDNQMLAKDKLKILYKARECRAMAVHPDGTYVASIAANTITMHSLALQKSIKFVHSCHLTSIAFHPTDNFIATGDEEGQIILWFQYEKEFMEESSVIVSSLHWHAHAVWSLSFSRDGAYMLSGGEEAVLVSWQLATGKKHFLPRLGASIASIVVSADANTYALALANNSISLVDAIASRVHSSIEGLVCSRGTLYRPPLPPGLQTAESTGAVPFDDRSVYAGLQFFPNSCELVLNGLPGSIQFYDLQSDKSASIVTVGPVSRRNVVSRMDTDLGNQTSTRIEHIAFSSDGSCMVTIERRTESIPTKSKHTPHSNVVTIKFWDHSSSTEPPGWLLNSRMESPHKDRIMSVRFHPHCRIVVTCSRDHTFRIWAPQRIEEPPNLDAVRGYSAPQSHLRPSEFWNCRATGSYRNYLVTAADWSPDGSLLAVTYGQVVTLWSINDEFELTLRHTLVHPDPSSHVIRVIFSPNSPFFYAHTRNTLYCWCLMSKMIAWSASCRVSSMCASSRFVAIVADVATLTIQGTNSDSEISNDHAEQPSKLHRDMHVLLLEKGCNIPADVWSVSDILIEHHSESIGSAAFAAFLPRINGSIVEVLVYLNQRRQLVLLSPSKTPAPHNTVSAALSLHSSHSELADDTRIKPAFAGFGNLDTLAKAVRLRQVVIDTNADTQKSVTAAQSSAVGGSSTAKIAKIFEADTHKLPDASLMLIEMLSILNPLVQRQPAPSGDPILKSVTDAAILDVDSSTRIKKDVSFQLPLTDPETIDLSFLRPIAVELSHAAR